MAEWCLEHPWLTFFLVYQALVVLDNIIVNVLNFILAARMIEGKDSGNEGEQ